MAKKEEGLSYDDEVVTVPKATPKGLVPTLAKPNISSPDLVFKVQFGQYPEHLVGARNDREAWALYCDHVQSWPSPKTTARVFEQVA